MDLHYIKEEMDHHQITGVSMAILTKGEIGETVCVGFRDKEDDQPIDPSTLFHACSISKFLTAIAVLKLVDERVLSLDEDVNDYLSSWKLPKHGFTNVTIRHLLSHQSGIIDPEGSFLELKEHDEFPSIAAILTGSTPYHDGPVRVTVEPGTQFHYSDTGFCILQVVIEDVLKKSFQEAVSALILKPLQMNRSTFGPVPMRNVASGHHKNGRVVEGTFPIYPYPAAAGLWTTPSELATLAAEIFRSLKGEGKIGLSSWTARDMIRPQGSCEWTGLGLFLDQTEQGVEVSSLGWGVGFQSALVALPERESGIIVMTNTDLGIHQMKGLIGKMVRHFQSGQKENAKSC